MENRCSHVYGKTYIVEYAMATNIYNFPGDLACYFRKFAHKRVKAVSREPRVKWYPFLFFFFTMYERIVNVRMEGNDYIRRRQNCGDEILARQLLSY